MLKNFPICFLSLWLLFPPFAAAAAQPLPEAKDGIINLSSWDPEKVTKLPLGGAWNFYWQRLESEDELRTGAILQSEPTSTITIGKTWAEVKPSVTQAFGYVTYTIKIEGFTAPANEYGLVFSQFFAAYRAYHFDPDSKTLTLLSSIGRIGKTGKESIPQNLKKIVPLPALNTNGSYIIIQTSSFLTPGGFALVPEIGRFEILQTAEVRTNWEAFWILGMFCLLFISNLSIYALRRDDYPSLIMGLFALLMGVRFFSTEAILAHFYTEPNLLSFSITYFILSLALPLGMSLYLTFFSLTFAGQYPQWALRSTWGLSALLFASMLLFLVIPSTPVIFSQIMLGQMVLGGIMFYRLVRLVLRGERGAGLSLIGITLIVSAMTNDVLVWMRAYEFAYIGHYGMIAFIFTQSLVVGSNFAYAFQTADRLSKHLQVEVERQTRDVKTILKNIHQGIFTVRPGLLVGDDYSSYLSEILGTESIQNRPALELVFAQSNLTNEQKSMITSILESSLDELDLNFEVNADNLVREFVYTDPKGQEKILLVDWDPVVNEKTSSVEKILVTLRDVTELKVMEAKNKQHQRDMELISEIIEIPADRFMQFLQSSRRFLAENLRLLEQADKPSDEALKMIFINYHTIKGAARTYRFTRMTGIVHDAEHFVASIQKGTAGWDGPRAQEDLQKVMNAFNEYEHVNRDKLKRVETKNTVNLDLDTVRENIKALETIGQLHLDERLTPFVDRVRRTFFQLYYQDVASLFADITRVLPQLARDLNKPEPEAILRSVPAGVSQEAVDVLHDVFIHVLRNTMDHGLETAEERTLKGKTPRGKITFDVTLAQDGFLRIRITDDGQGVRLDRIHALAQQRGLIKAGQSYKPVEIANLIFLPGFSTAKGLTEVSGRGVGMSAVREYIEKVGGRVELVLNAQTNELQAVPFSLDIYLHPRQFTIFQEVQAVA